MNARLSSPAHDEQSGSEEERSNHHRHQAGFGNHLVIVGNHALAVIGLAPEVDSRCESDSHNNGEERERTDHFIPAAYLLEFNWEGCDCTGMFVSQFLTATA